MHGDSSSFEEAQQRGDWQMLLAEQMGPVSERHEALRFEIAHRNALAQDAVAALQKEMAEIAELERQREQCWNELHDFMAGIAGAETADRMYPRKSKD